MYLYGCSPYASHVTQVTLREGDVVLAATDGLYSNMFQDDIISVLKGLKVRRSSRR